MLKATTGLAQAAVGVASLAAGEGITGWTIAHGQPVAAADALADPRFKLLPEAEETTLRSLLAVPLTVEGRTIGAMNVQTHEIHPYADDEVELLSLIGNLAAGALEKAALHDRMKRQIAELEGLVKVSQTVTSPLYLDEMLKVVVEMAGRLMGASAVALYLVDEAGGAPVLRASHVRPGGNGNAPTLAAAVPAVEAAVQSGKPQSQTGEAGSLLVVPLVVRERAIGAMGCLAEGRREFSPKDVDVFTSLASQTALAIENARLVITSAVVREMHHRVKNNLQTVAMLLRLQMGAADDAKSKAILADAITRILSIASVHETLSEQGLKRVDVRQVLQRVARAVVDTVLVPGRDIAVDVQSDALSLPSRAATSLALAAAELVQNAVKHAFTGRDKGRVALRLKVGGAECVLEVEDDGLGTAAARPTRKGLGMEIVQTLVAHDLKGRFESQASEQGTKASIRFPPLAAEGEKP
jgi:two-component sensor histidine kinase